MRLSHFIAKCGYASRRKADALIREGRVKVNSRIILEPFFRITDEDAVAIGSKVLKLESNLYFIFNKPKGVTTTLSDRHAKVTLKEFLPVKGIYPVGRLDKESTGLLIVTNDGDFCYRMTHPRFGVKKEYVLEVSGKVVPADCRKALRGIRDKEERLKVDQIDIIKKTGNGTVCRVVVHEGKKRHLRRLFGAIGLKVTELKRVRVGNLSLGNLKPGSWREISRKNAYEKCLGGRLPFSD